MYEILTIGITGYFCSFIAFNYPSPKSTAMGTFFIIITTIGLIGKFIKS